MTWLVTGGAGYIGAHVVRALRAAQQPVVALDDLSTGVAARLPGDVPLVKGDVRDPALVSGAIDRFGITGVVHLAARKDVYESIVDPLSYYQDNLDGVRAVIASCLRHQVRHAVYSSSAAVYGTPDTPLVDESAPVNPANPYGRSKLVGEWMFGDAVLAGGPCYVALRYFNVAGAGADNLGDNGGTNLLPRLLRCASTGPGAAPFTVHGTDYPTPDGSCVRDYIHVRDVAEAHVAAALALRGGAVTAEVLNVGGGTGVSVLEMTETVTRITGRPVAATPGPRRSGDPARVVASAERIRQRLGWQARHDLADIVSSAWQALGPLPTRPPL